MKNLILLFLLFAGYQSMAQTVSGTVSNDKGQPVRYAFVQDDQTKDAAYSDSTGAFSLKATPTSKLAINCKGYSDAAVDVGGNSTIQITLTTNPNASKASAGTAIDDAFKTSSGYDVPNTALAFGATGTNTIDVVGSRFLFNKWVPGYIIKANGSTAQDPQFLFNYDKIKGDLFYNQNGTVTVADKNVVKGFVLISLQDQPVTFERMTGISNDLYSIVLSAGPRYKIYKLIKTKYVPSDYKTDGLMSTGNKYDEYDDAYTYYVMNMKTLAFQPLDLKKKAIKTAFAAEGDKLNSFMNDHSSDKIDDDYLKALGNAMNQ